MPQSYPQLLPRGVYRLPLLTPNGSLCACCIAHDGRALSWLWYAPESEQATFNALWDVLDEQDPPRNVLKVS